MEDKKILLNEIKKLWNNKTLPNFDIDESLLEYLDVKDLQNLKAKILNSLTTLSSEQKEWLAKFRKEND
jgi:hypothetical protein